MVLVAGAALVWAHATRPRGAPLRGARRDLPASVAFAAICVACAAPDAPRLLSCRPPGYLGRLSYGIYLWHDPVLLGLQAHGLLPVDDVAATCDADRRAAVTWHLVERRALGAARWRLDRRRARATGPALRPLRPATLPT